MTQLDGYSDGSNLVCRLHHPLYGLKQAGREWYKKLNNTLTKYNLLQSDVDHCVYIKQQENKITILTMWVDNILIAGNDTTECEKIKNYLKKEFDTKDLGEAKLLLRMEITQD
jgi:Reverse transcriptase (RNA-dependent DNA polymerase)